MGTRIDGARLTRTVAANVRPRAVIAVIAGRGIVLINTLPANALNGIRTNITVLGTIGCHGTCRTLFQLPAIIRHAAIRRRGITALRTRIHFTRLTGTAGTTVRARAGISIVASGVIGRMTALTVVAYIIRANVTVITITVNRAAAARNFSIGTGLTALITAVGCTRITVIAIYGGAGLAALRPADLRPVTEISVRALRRIASAIRNGHKIAAGTGLARVRRTAV